MNGQASRLNATHFLFVATNCWFVRPGLEAFVGARVASLAARACPEASSRDRCVGQPWFAALNRPHRTPGQNSSSEEQPGSASGSGETFTIRCGPALVCSSDCGTGS